MSNVVDIEKYIFATREESKHLRNLSNGYCIECNKPSYSYILCSACNKKLLRNAYDKNIKFGDLGNRTINYQQHLHRLFFGCNAVYEYRGLKENRIRTKIKKETILYATNEINKLLNTYYEHFYTHVKHFKNIDKRILYNITLHFIDYYILKTKDYTSDIHFYTQVIRRIYHTMIRLIHSNNYSNNYNVYRHINKKLFRESYYTTNKIFNLFMNDMYS